MDARSLTGFGWERTLGRLAVQVAYRQRVNLNLRGIRAQEQRVQRLELLGSLQAGKVMLEGPTRARREDRPSLPAAPSHP